MSHKRPEGYRKEYMRIFRLTHKALKAEDDRKYRAKYPEKCAARAKRYREDHREQEAKRAKEYAKVHREHINGYWRNRRKTNPIAWVKHNELVRRYQEEHREHLRLKQKEYDRAHPEVRKAIKARRRLRESLDGGLSKETVQRVYEANILFWGTLTCCLCETPISFGDDHLEHLTPLSRGGDNRFENLGIAHSKCNFRKHYLTELEYRAYAE